MAIFNLKSIKSSDSPFRTRYFNELQVNGEDVNDTDDFTIDDDESEDNESTNTGEETADTGENTPEDAAQDAAENPSEEDNQAAEDLGADTTDDEEDDFTLDDEDDSSTADDNEAPATEENTETTDTTSDDDFTMDDTDQSEGEANTEDSGDTAPAEGENNPEGGGEDTATDDIGADDFTMDDSQGGGDPAGRSVLRPSEEPFRLLPLHPKKDQPRRRTGEAPSRKDGRSGDRSAADGLGQALQAAQPPGRFHRFRQRSAHHRPGQPDNTQGHFGLCAFRCPVCVPQRQDAPLRLLHDCFQPPRQPRHRRFRLRALRGRVRI